jgi:hypothetical protein
MATIVVHVRVESLVVSSNAFERISVFALLWTMIWAIGAGLGVSASERTLTQPVQLP